ncbi:NADPH-dependent D-xylose reductase [Planoprotostelium fungivorum]|uniref:aldose reductase n=1 Tax=Planoprotostelium fungivorum TaxID=1890364 RepID=A0A2P6NZV5_9EUKA|nr:NADPH-dependent D-xylose reductase [Planoprotostelium fungivorum]
MSLGRTFTLNTGATIPAVGLGTWQSKPHEVEKAVEVALKAGYRHIDAAYAYKNEGEVGAGIKASGVPRDQIFITTKLWCTFHRPENVQKGLDESLSLLGLDYVDLFLVHWPVPLNPRENPAANLFPTVEDGSRDLDFANVNLKDTWQAMEKMVELGKAKAIGVSNWNVRRLKELLTFAKIKPAVNQVELHPYLAQWDLQKFCEENGVLLTAYSPLGSTTSPLLTEPVITDIAKKTGKSVAQVLVSWAVQRGTVVIPKSVTASRIEENFQDFVLEKADFEAINELSKNKHQRLISPKWGVDVFEESA